MYVLNEKKYINDIIESYIKPEEMSIYYLTTLLSKFFVDKYNEYNDFVKKIKEEILKFNIDGYQEYLYSKVVNEICDDIFYDNDKRNFKELEFIPIYQSDIDLLDSLSNDKYKKIMFTLIVNARYMDCDGWVNKKTSDGIRELFKQANISGGSDIRDLMLHDLYKNGYISFAKSNMNQNIKINNFDNYGDIVYKVTSFKHLGNQYIGNFKKGYMMCKECGKIIKVKGSNTMYCAKCREQKRLETKRNWWNNQ